MKKYNLAIVDDNAQDAAILKKHIERYFAENGGECNVFVFAKGGSFLNNRKVIYNIIFMDIDMPYMNGIEVSEKLREFDDTTTLVFISSFPSFAIETYAVKAVEFMVKPIDYYSFALKFKRILKVSSQNDAEKICITQEGQAHIIDISCLKYIEVMAHCLVFHTTSGNIQSPGSLADYIRKLSSYHFVQVYRCYLVNLRYVTAINNLDVQVGEDILRISRNKKKALMQKLFEYYNGK